MPVNVDRSAGNSNSRSNSRSNSNSNSSSAAAETERNEELEALSGISQSLQCGLDRRTLLVLLQLVEQGVHPEALADLVLELRQTLPAEKQ